MPRRSTRSPDGRGSARSSWATSATRTPAGDGCGRVDAVAHLAASISVQESIDDPATTFENDVVGTFNVLEAARTTGARVLFMSTCMVYDRADRDGIDEDHPTKPASPYAASKLAGEALTLSYHHAYGLPTTVVRPFNTYGPFQRSVGEGGVVAIFTRRSILGEELRIFGDGTQTRDLLYVEDCARFVVAALASDAALGRVLNAGTGADVSINELAALIEPDASRIVHVPHIHPAERDRGPALRSAAGSGAARLASNGRAARGPRAGACVDGGAPRSPGYRCADGDRRRDPAGHRRRHAGPRHVPAIRPPGHLRGGRRRRRRGAPFRLADHRAARAGVRVAARRGDRRAACGRVQLGTAALHGATVAAGSARATRRSPRR